MGASILLEEYLSGFRNTQPFSLLDAPIFGQLEGDSTCAGRRSGRLEKKNKDCNIPTAKRAEHRLSESFGDRPKEVVSKKRITPVTAQAVRELLQVNVSRSGGFSRALMLLRERSRGCRCWFGWV
jgi:hypothetical protein